MPMAGSSVPNASLCAGGRRLLQIKLLLARAAWHVCWSHHRLRASVQLLINGPVLHRLGRGAAVGLSC